MTIEDRIRERLAQSGKALTGKVFLVGLDQMHPDVGKQDSRAARTLEVAMDSAIRKRIGDGDYMARIDGYGFLIIFGDVAEEEARLKCALMVDQITRFLFGDKIVQGAVEVKAVVAEVDGSIDVEGVSITDTISQLLDQAAETAAAVGGVENVTAGREKADAKDIQFIFRPMWDVKRRVISTYVCIPIVASKISSGYHFGYGAHADTAVLDFQTLNHAVTEMQALLKKGRKLLIGLSVHIDTLMTPKHRLGYTAQLQSIPDEVRQYLVYEIVGATQGLPEIRMLEFVTLLRQFCRNVIARVSLSGDLQLNALKRSGVVAIGDEFSLNSRAEALTIAEIETFAEAANDAGLNTYLHGLRSLSLAVAATAAGIDFIDGDPIMSLAKSPEGVFRFETMDLYSRFLKENEK